MATKRIPKVPDYWWFPEASTAAIAARIAAPGARLKVTPYLKDGTWALMLDTMPSGSSGDVIAESHTGINDSHACPPWCGGG